MSKAATIKTKPTNITPKLMKLAGMKKLKKSQKDNILPSVLGIIQPQTVANTPVNIIDTSNVQNSYLEIYSNTPNPAASNKLLQKVLKPMGDGFLRDHSRKRRNKSKKSYDEEESRLCNENLNPNYQANSIKTNPNHNHSAIDSQMRLMDQMNSKILLDEELLSSKDTPRDRCLNNLYENLKQKRRLIKNHSLSMINTNSPNFPGPSIHSGSPYTSSQRCRVGLAKPFNTITSRSNQKKTLHKSYSRQRVGLIQDQNDCNSSRVHPDEQYSYNNSCINSGRENDSKYESTKERFTSDAIKKAIDYQTLREKSKKPKYYHEICCPKGPSFMMEKEFKIKKILLTDSVKHQVDEFMMSLGKMKNNLIDNLDLLFSKKEDTMNLLTKESENIEEIYKDLHDFLLNNQLKYLDYLNKSEVQIIQDIKVYENESIKILESIDDMYDNLKANDINRDQFREMIYKYRNKIETYDIFINDIKDYVIKLNKLPCLKYELIKNIKNMIILLYNVNNIKTFLPQSTTSLSNKSLLTKIENNNNNNTIDKYATNNNIGGNNSDITHDSMIMMIDHDKDKDINHIKSIMPMSINTTTITTTTPVTIIDDYKNKNRINLDLYSNRSYTNIENMTERNNHSINKGLNHTAIINTNNIIHESCKMKNKTNSDGNGIGKFSFPRQIIDDINQYKIENFGSNKNDSNRHKNNNNKYQNNQVNYMNNQRNDDNNNSKNIINIDRNKIINDFDTKKRDISIYKDDYNDDMKYLILDKFQNNTSNNKPTFSLQNTNGTSNNNDGSNRNNNNNNNTGSNYGYDTNNNNNNKDHNQLLINNRTIYHDNTSIISTNRQNLQNILEYDTMDNNKYNIGQQHDSLKSILQQCDSNRNNNNNNNNTIDDNKTINDMINTTPQVDIHKNINDNKKYINLLEKINANQSRKYVDYLKIVQNKPPISQRCNNHKNYNSAKLSSDTPKIFELIFNEYINNNSCINNNNNSNTNSNSDGSGSSIININNDDYQNNTMMIGQHYEKNINSNRIIDNEYIKNQKQLNSSRLAINDTNISNNATHQKILFCSPNFKDNIPNC